MPDIWRQFFMEEEDLGFHLWAYPDKDWTFGALANQPGERGREGTKHQGSLLHLVLCGWRNRRRPRQRWGYSLLVPVSSSHLELFALTMVLNYSNLFLLVGICNSNQPFFLFFFLFFFFSSLSLLMKLLDSQYRFLQESHYQCLIICSQHQ